MKQIYLLIFLYCSTTFAQNGIKPFKRGEEKFYYTGKESIVTGWTGPWPIDQQESIFAICEAIFEEGSEKPIDVSHLKLNSDGTLKCPAEVSEVRKEKANKKEVDRKALAQTMKDMACGKRIQARNIMESKRLSRANKNNRKGRLTEVKDLLDEGDLAGAEEALLAMSTDASFNASDKTAMINEMDKCK